MKTLRASHRAGILLASILLLPPALAEDTKVQPDIKPALAKEGLDQEQLRLARLIHKRIIEKQKEEKAKLALYKETLDSGAQFDMVPIKGGTFTWKGEEKGDVLEATISPFWMAKHEVIWEEYDPYMYTEGARIKNGHLPDFMRENPPNEIDLLARPTTPHHPMTFGMPRDGHPAVAMTQHAANQYCQWISYQTGHFYRLPTEAEWEYACRAGQATNGSWGEDYAKAGDYAWFGEEGTFYKKPGLKKPNAWGIYDMHGNVMEWTLDQHVPNRRTYFGKDKVTDPWIKATKPYPHVVKGGQWKQQFEDIGAAKRLKSDPQWKKYDPQIPKSLWYHTDYEWPVGMRVVRPLKTPTAEEMYHYWNSGVEAEEE